MNYVTQDGVLYNKDKTTLICYPAMHPGKGFSMPGTVTTIGSSAFYGSSILTDITIPDSVTTIGYGVFYDCSALTGVIIPPSVTSIGNQAFYSCEALIYLTIPSSVTSIGNGAFKDCTALTSVYFDGSMPTMDSSVFDNCPASLKCYYQSGKTGFGYGSITFEACEVKTVTVDSSIANGTITTSTTSGMPGETIRFKITPDAGYILKPGSLKYNDGSDEITITGTSITMPNKAITVSAVFDNGTAPTVSGVTPSGTGISIGGNIAITFSEAMNTTAGTVSLNGGTSLTGGTWSADKLTYTIPYSGLSYSTAYTIAISGFKDAAGNTMTADSSNGFTTMAAPPAMMLGTSGITGGGANWVYSGEYSGSPLMWRVLDTNNDYDSTTGSTQSALFLLSEYILDSSNIKFDNDGVPNAGQTYPNEWAAQRCANMVYELCKPNQF